VDGGGGVDTLKLDGAGLTLDLTSINNTRIQDIEIIDIRGLYMFLSLTDFMLNICIFLRISFGK
jgi:hypothetical protein